MMQEKPATSVRHSAAPLLASFSISRREPDPGRCDKDRIAKGRSPISLRIVQTDAVRQQLLAHTNLPTRRSRGCPSQARADTVL